MAMGWRSPPESRAPRSPDMLVAAGSERHGATPNCETLIGDFYLLEALHSLDRKGAVLR